jgi:SAM-dependent methyltransferase
VAVAQYAQPADESHWSALWAQNQLERLLVVAGRDPLSAHLQGYLPASGVILEGGCGLGQYVLYFRRKGYAVVGGDFSVGALQAHHTQQGTTPLAAMDLRALPFGDEAIAAHISLGVVEHLEDGPEPILREIVRTLRPGGVALVSVPWMNGLRTLFRPILKRRERQKQAAGMAFYQYYYRRGEMRRFLEQVGLRVVGFQPYSPGKGLREFLPVRRRPAGKEGFTAEGAEDVKKEGGGGEGEGVVVGWRRVLYGRPVLAMTAHMILAVAVKEGGEKR